MKILNIGYNFTHEYNYKMIRAEGAPHHVFIHIKSPAVFVIDDVTYNVAPNSILIYKKGTPQNYGAEGGVYVNDWFQFELDNDEMNNFTLPFNKIITFKDTTVLSHYVERIYFETYSRHTHKNEKINCYFTLLCCEILDLLEEQNFYGTEPNNLYNIRSLFYARPHVKWSNKSAAKISNMSESYFKLMYKKTFGVSPMYDLILARIEKSKYMLTNSTSNINTISNELGYKNDVSFMKQFKQITGLTPSEYRKQH